ncbi:MBL fold metallo-hydrolase [Paenibacillus xerothermodurans]|uniref:MBL fold metallo-hydrolase n=1 Tax=Paenibacillus xerothermodurans TaxID=1977292 RepID=A0A2W1NL99_PAEXE|nr:MBL fold metallo-hydrolase [Paenibacillus xerothermodurans]PZE19773.1 MBL fold metallo-hydrolase [Paenibacillus xerothermodurans]
MKIVRKRYENMNGVRHVGGINDLRKWRKERRAKVKDMSYTVPMCEERQVELLRDNQELTTITWIGHSTFLIQMAGLNVLTDPVWAERMGLERRLTPPGLSVRELPRIDVVLLSHSHYDHMDMRSLREFKAAHLFVPEGLGSKLRARGFARVTEMSWWDREQLGGLELHFVPAQHWTRRTLIDTNRSHWGGWVLQPAARSEERAAVYFAGDSGYFPGFKMIGERFAIRYALLPIGAYEPEWFMSAQHVTPEEAVQAFEDVQGEIFVPMHYGTFRLADDTPREALDRLLAEWERRKLPGDALRMLKLGETLM